MADLKSSSAQIERHSEWRLTLISPVSYIRKGGVAVRRLIYRYGWITYIGIVTASSIFLLGLAVLGQL